jgi:nitroreductase
MLNVSDALKQRISIRKFLPTPVPQALVRELLDAARWSPSGGNLQPWSVIVLAGAELDAIRRLAHGGPVGSGQQSEEGSDPVYPPNLWEPFRTRRWGLNVRIEPDGWRTLPTTLNSSAHRSGSSL